MTLSALLLACAMEPRDDVLRGRGGKLERGEFVVEDLYRDVRDERLNGVRCRETDRLRRCIAVTRREDDYFGEEEYTVITIERLGPVAPEKQIVIGSFSSNEPDSIGVMVYASAPNEIFANRMPDYVVARYPRSEWDAFASRPSRGELPQVVPTEPIPRAYHRYILSMILASTLEIHTLLEEK